MSRIITIFLLCCFFKTHAQIENDKALHFLGGNLYGLAGAGIAKQISKGDRFWTFAGAVGGSALIGLGKEAIDSGKGGSGWDNDDLLATVLGGLTVGVTIDIFTDHKKKRKLPTNKAANKVGYVPEINAENFTNAPIPSLSQLTYPFVY
ncbi:hypothetical protein [Croceivirga sp. JEA036]|uniref:hypothetical protein n=1 Tax=Croceivirga sp. JEA036 TaxID=2721162 RepID=UPI001ADA9770|nr:hypothetical protein [Croceivirga sp. JEA036]